MKSLRILGTRGIPATHGGFETFAEELSLYLVECGWKVSVYCQDVGGRGTRTEQWHGVELVHIGTSSDTALASVGFDLRAALHARTFDDTVLTLGYNTAIFSALYKRTGLRHIMNMDGLEWKRSKWSPPLRAWLYANERLAGWLVGELIADHPEIARHLATRGLERKTTVIPYGADPVDDIDLSPLDDLGINRDDDFALIVARPEPENSVRELVEAFSSRRRDRSLIVLGDYSRGLSYTDAVRSAASNEVRFVGGLYDQATVQALRKRTSLYLHGHTVGGTNPSLVEAMAAGSPVLAHDNPFNRHVVGDGARYFADTVECAAQMDALFDDPTLRKELSGAGRLRFDECFRNEDVLARYESMLLGNT